MPPLIPQPHGGALRAGGTPGNMGGQLGGRPPSWFRERLAELLAEAPTGTARKAARIDFAAEVLDGRHPQATIADRMTAWREMVRHLIPQRQELTVVSPEVRARLARQIEIIRASPHVTDAEALLNAIEEVWA